MGKTGRQSFQFMLRLPDELREKLKAIAEVNGRSMTGEIIARLEDTFAVESYGEALERVAVKDDLAQRSANSADIRTRLAAIEKKLDRLLKIEDQK